MFVFVCREPLVCNKYKLPKKTVIYFGPITLSVAKLPRTIDFLYPSIKIQIVIIVHKSSHKHLIKGDSFVMSWTANRMNFYGDHEISGRLFTLNKQLSKNNIGLGFCQRTVSVLRV